MGTKTIFLVVVIGFLFVLSGAYSAQNIGAANMILEGGKTGDVPFPHRMHQEDQANCNICHELFEQKAGSIEALKNEDILKSKQVMNTQCLKCHREMKKAGNATGPITCATCHIKSKRDD
ncbi:MAG: cytochrome c3 family protein [Desulfobacterales bacterium]